MSTIIVLGSSGQLGRCLQKVAAEKNIGNIHFLSTEEANVANKQSLAHCFKLYQPAHIINCAAYTAVDKAEEDIEAARKINKTGVKNIAELCLEYNSILIHVSTDFVFKGDKASPLTESDKTEPIGIYGLTKLEGEQAIASLLTDFYILRTSWLYSEFGANFLKTMLKLGVERDVVKVIADQVGTPTYAVDLAGAIFDLIAAENSSYGIYHYSNQGVASWYDFAKSIFELSGTQVTTVPIKTSEYPTKATRPSYSVLDKSKIKTNFGLDIPYWRDSLKVCIEALNQ